jgi:HlyD family secretion protein
MITERSLLLIGSSTLMMAKSFQERHMLKHYFFWIVLLALFGLFLTFFSMWQEVNTPPSIQEPLNPYPQSPFKSYISGVGIVEASSDNISIGTPVNRIVEKVLATAGMKIKKGDVLLKLEDQELKADLVARQVAYEIAQAQLKKLVDLPRQEDVHASEAVFRSAQIELQHAQDQYERVQGLQDSRALSLQEINRRRLNYEQAETKWDEARANLNKIKAGAWKPDIEIAKLQIDQAKADIEKIQADIQRTIIRSPIDGEVLQVRVHEGEFPASVSANGPLMIVGDTAELYLKVSINQFDAPFFRSDAPAVAFLRGNGRIEFPLEFVRLDPYLVNKQNFTNEITEKVDTRVLQVIYHIKKIDQNIFVGQQMDVFIEAEFPS